MPAAADVPAAGIDCLKFSIFGDFSQLAKRRTGTICKGPALGFGVGFAKQPRFSLDLMYIKIERYGISRFEPTWPRLSVDHMGLKNHRPKPALGTTVLCESDLRNRQRESAKIGDRDADHRRTASVHYRRMWGAQPGALAFGLVYSKCS
jgi:hypothetical protein